MKDYTILLREHDLKATPQRLAILEIIENFGHINVDDLYEKVKNKFSSISLATIYKNINSMTQSRLLFEVKLPYKKPVFEITKQKHSHLQCMKCGDIVDIELDISSIENEIESEYQFKIDQSDLVFSGCCKKCA